MAKEFKKLNRGGELCWVLGILFISLGVAICKKADLGVSMIAACLYYLRCNQRASAIF